MTRQLTSHQQHVLTMLDATATNVVTGSTVMNIVGVLAGIKPAALIEEAEQAKPFIEELGLVSMEIASGALIVSTDATSLESLKKDVESTYGKKGAIDEEAEYRIGAALGYPPTSTAYFLKRLPTVMTESPLPFVTLEPGPRIPHENFRQLVLSPEQYQQELDAYAWPLDAATKRYAPHTYEVLTRDEA